MLDNASDDGSAEAVRERHPEARLFALDRRDREGRQRHAAPARGARALLPAAERGLRAAGRRRARAARRARGGSARRGRRRAAARRATARPTAVRVAAPRHPLGARARRLHAPTAWPCRAAARAVRPVGWVQSSAMLVRRAAAEQVGWLDPRLLRLLRRDGLLQAPRRRRLADPVRARGVGRCTTTSSATDAAAMRRADRRVPPQPRPLLPQARAAGSRGCVLAALLDLAVPRARGGRGRCCRATTPRRYLLHARQELAPGRGRGHPRGRRGPQPPPPH